MRTQRGPASSNSLLNDRKARIQTSRELRLKDVALGAHNFEILCFSERVTPASPARSRAARFTRSPRHTFATPDSARAYETAVRASSAGFAGAACRCGRRAAPVRPSWPSTRELQRSRVTVARASDPRASFAASARRSRAGTTEHTSDHETAATLESPQLLVEAPGTHSTSSIIFFEEAFTALRRARALYLFSLATCEATAAGVEALGHRRREKSHRSRERPF